jgi:hypothetical protein
MQESLFTILNSQTADAKRDLKPLFFSKDLDEKNQLIVRSAILDELLSAAEPKLRERYDWRQDLMRRGVPPETVIPPDVLELLRQNDLRIRTPLAAAEYIAACEAQEVPIPPDWPDERWVHQGRLGFTFISMGRTADVYTYKALDVPGICYALPRANARGKIELLSITCQSKRTGKACFWDNRTIMDELISPVTTLVVHNIGNGYTLGENCTDCHRGYNAYNIHPGTVLDVTRSKVVPAPYDPDRPWESDPDVRYSPIGRPAYQNPPPLDSTQLPPPAPIREGFVPACNGCHEIPQTRGALYCGSVLTQAMSVTMPPRPGRPPAFQWTRDDFREHINRLRACP